MHTLNYRYLIWVVLAKRKNRLYKEKQNYQVDIFGYQYTSGSGKNKSTNHFTVVGFNDGETSFPSFGMRPQNFQHNIGKKFGYQDINFPENKIFSKRILLRSDDESAIRKIFHIKLLTLLENEEDLCVEAHNEQIIFYRKYKRIKPEDIKYFYEKVERLYRAFLKGASD